MEWLSEEWFWKVIVPSSLVAALVTTVWNRVQKSWDEDALRSAIKQAIQAEIDYAADFGHAYLMPDSVKVPLHRITTSLYEGGVPKLIALGAINSECAMALLQYYAFIDQMNRSLDLAQSSQAEIGRALMKACALVSARDLQGLADMPRESVIETATIRTKIREYGNMSPYDRVKRAMGLV